MIINYFNFDNMFRKNIIIFTIIQFLLIIDSTKQQQFRSAIMAFKAIGKTIKNKMIKKISNNSRNSMSMFFRDQSSIKNRIFGFEKKYEKYWRTSHNVGSKSVKYLRENRVYKSKKNIFMTSAEQIGEKGFKSFFNMITKNKPYIPVLAGLGFTNLNQRKDTLNYIPNAKQPDNDLPPLKLNNKNKYLLLSGPSGVGKGTLVKELQKKYNSHIGFSVSYTTRQPRPHEKDGKHYHFVTDKVFKKELDKGNFLEHVSFAGLRYGTNKKCIEKIIADKKVCILDVEINGAKMISDSSYKGILVFVKPPNFTSLERRLQGRGTETEEVIDKRIDQAKIDLEKLEQDNFFTYTIENDNLKTATGELLDIFKKEFLE